MFIDLNCFLRWAMWPMGLLFTQYFERFVSKIPVNLYWLCGNRVQVEITGDLSCSLLPLLLDTVLFLSFLHQQTICPVLNSARKFFSCAWKILFDTWFCLMIALLFFFQTKELFTSHLYKYLRKEARSKGQSVAKEYIACQVGWKQMNFYKYWQNACLKMQYV